jgi:transcriptional regulator with XRE-family HTH domain
VQAAGVRHYVSVAGSPKRPVRRTDSEKVEGNARGPAPGISEHPLLFAIPVRLSTTYGEQRSIARKMSVDQSRISLWENARAVPSILDVLNLCRACDEPPERLLADLITPSAEKMRLELDAEAGEAVYRITKFLHARSARRPGPAPAESEAS